MSITTLDHSERSTPVEPAAPTPPQKRLGLPAAIRALRENPIAAFPREAYEAPMLEIGRRWRVVLVNDPEAIERVLVHNAGNYCKSRQQQQRLKPALGDGLLTAEGTRWRSTRRITAPLFSPRAIAALFEDMRAAADAMANRWHHGQSVEAPLDLAAEFQRLTYEIVSRTVFSGALDEDRLRIHAHMAIYFDTLGRIDLASILDLPAWWPSLAGLRVRPSLSVFRAVVDRVVSERAADREREAIDLLDRLMHAQDSIEGHTLPAAAVADNVLTFLAAGHETTGNALAWIIYLLALFPRVEGSVVEELRITFGDGKVSRERFGRLILTRAVVNEALRLYPPAPFIGRLAVDDDQLCGRPIRKGTQVLISPWLVHRHRALWSDPDAFRPQRFLPAQADTLPRGAFLPFGLGPRICIGQGFAIQEILTVLATILPKFRIELVHPEKIFPQARITLQPAGGMPARARPR